MRMGRGEVVLLFVAPRPFRITGGQVDQAAVPPGGNLAPVLPAHAACPSSEGTADQGPCTAMVARARGGHITFEG